MSLLCACSNSEGVDYPGWENASIDNGNSNEDDDVIVEPEKPSCFNSFRLPDLQSIACKKQFYTNDTVKDFPQSGFFQKTFTITFPDNKPLNCEIGGKPVTKESPLVSTIQVDSSMAIRCADFSGKSASAEIIRTYILEKNPDIAAVFLTTDPNSLFDPDTGIYMEGPNAETAYPHYGANYWLDKEIPAFVELIESEQNAPAFAKYAGLKIFGNYSRLHPKKSVAITFREKYGEKRLHYKLFSQFPELNVFKSFVLRNSGTNFGTDYIRDRLATSLSEGLGLDYQRGKFVIVYYNGKYFGIHDLRERSNKYYFETHYGLNPANINLIETSMANDTASAGSSSDYEFLINWLKDHNLDDENNYDYISSKIDINNIINYMQVEMFAFNRDWPGNNQKKWNLINPQTPWNWFLYDMDLSFGRTINTIPSNVFNYVLSETEIIWQNSPKHTFLFRRLFTNESFRAAFINRMPTLLQMNFESSKVIAQIDNMMAEIESEIPRDQSRWSLDASKMKKQLDIIKQFSKERPSTLINHLQEFFKLGEAIPTTLSVKGNGKIYVHDLPLDNTPKTILFFKNFPVTITAEPQNESKWYKWSDGDTNMSKIILPEKDKNITAIFK